VDSTPAPDVRIFPDAVELSFRAAEAATTAIADAIESHGRCSLVLSGGASPRNLHELLASRFSDRIQWPQVHVFWGDERYVSHDDAHSNYAMARTTLLDHVPCPAANVHPMPTHFADSEDAAHDYETTLRRYFGNEPPRFDLVFLGLGRDGHTASLFPNSPALHERARWVVAATTPAEPPLRLTLTLPALNQSRRTFFLVIGPDKAHALGRVLAADAEPTSYPAAGIDRARGTVVWWATRDAAAELGRSKTTR
jgi:6-phosphogluconolactonase